MRQWPRPRRAGVRRGGGAASGAGGARAAARPWPRSAARHAGSRAAELAELRAEGPSGPAVMAEALQGPDHGSRDAQPDAHARRAAPRRPGGASPGRSGSDRSAPAGGAAINDTPQMTSHDRIPTSHRRLPARRRRIRARPRHAERIAAARGRRESLCRVAVAAASGPVQLLLGCGRDRRPRRPALAFGHRARSARRTAGSTWSARAPVATAPSAICGC